MTVFRHLDFLYMLLFSVWGRPWKALWCEIYPVRQRLLYTLRWSRDCEFNKVRYVLPTSHDARESGCNHRSGGSHRGFSWFAGTPIAIAGSLTQSREFKGCVQILPRYERLLLQLPLLRLRGVSICGEHVTCSDREVYKPSNGCCAGPLHHSPGSLMSKLRKRLAHVCCLPQCLERSNVVVRHLIPSYVVCAALSVFKNARLGNIVCSVFFLQREGAEIKSMIPIVSPPSAPKPTREREVCLACLFLLESLPHASHARTLACGAAHIFLDWQRDCFFDGCRFQTSKPMPHASMLGAVFAFSEFQRSPSLRHHVCLFGAQW